jgi:hypothetical protein
VGTGTYEETPSGLIWTTAVIAYLFKRFGPDDLIAAGMRMGQLPLHGVPATVPETPKDERPAAGGRQTDADVRSSLPPGSKRKDDEGGVGDNDRAQPYDEEPAVLRMEDVDPPHDGV